MAIIAIVMAALIAHTLLGLSLQQTLEGTERMTSGPKRGASVLSCALTIVVSTGFIWLATNLLAKVYLNVGSATASALVVPIAGGFLLIAAAFHYGAYCVGGLVSELCGAAWPKLIDYPYYLAGAVLLVSVANQSSLPGGLALVALKLEIALGMVLLNLKLLKTSIEIAPSLFASPEALIRTWPLSQVIKRR